MRRILRRAALLTTTLTLVGASAGCACDPEDVPDGGAVARDAAQRDGATLDGSEVSAEDTGTVVASDGATEPRRDAGPACVGCGPCEEGAELTEFERTLIELPPDSWYDAPGTHMREVCVPDSFGVRGVVGCPAIILAWNGGAIDTRRQRLVIWGGGHDDYHGNELYGFDLRRGSWERLTEPTAPMPGWLDQDPLYDGNPVSRHTYDGVEYISHLDVLFGHGGSRAAGGGSTNLTWLFDFDTESWSRHADGGPGDYTLAVAYDPNGRQVFVRSSQSLWTYLLDQDRWQRAINLGYAPYNTRYSQYGNKTGVFDPTRNLFWSVGGGDILVWDAVAGTMVTDDWVTEGGGDYTNVDKVGTENPDRIFVSGGGDIYDAKAPGFDYDSATDSLVGWPNAGAPRILDLTTKRWTLGSDEGAPTSRASGGTFGRFRYVPAYNVFVLVTSVDEDVHFYKHTAGCGPGRG